MSTKDLSKFVPTDDELRAIYYDALRTHLGPDADMDDQITICAILRQVAEKAAKAAYEGGRAAGWEEARKKYEG